MSCGPSEAMKAAAEQVDALNAKIDAAIMDIPGMDELANLKENAESAAQGLMDKLSDAIPSINFPELPPGAKSLQDEMKEIAGYIALGAFFSTSTKKVKYKATTKILNKVKKLTKTPIVAIGGINFDNYKKLLLNKANLLAISGYIWNNKKYKPLESVEKLK